jgi:muramoyltetrapeptide carboxypeptidase
VTIKPSPLRKGDSVAVISPASTPDQASLTRGKRKLESMGFSVKLGPTMKKLFEGGMLSAPDSERVSELHWAFESSEIKAIISSGGGYGTLRIVELLNYDLIKRNPKIIMGFSDLTALLNCITQTTDLVTFHGPMVAVDFGRENPSKYVLDWFIKATSGQGPLGVIDYPDDSPPVRTIVDGSASGQLVGGNLTLLVRMFGTRFEPRFEGKIVLIEEVGEDPYEIDGMLTQLILNGRIRKSAGIVFSQCVDCPVPERAGRSINRLTLESVVKERLQKIGVPSIFNFHAGHNIHKPTLPLGVNAKLDASNCTLEVTEPGVNPA